MVTMSVDSTAWALSACYVISVYTGMWFLSMLLPGRRSRGSAKDCNGKHLEYKLNGLLCTLVGCAAVYVVSYAVPTVQLDFLITHFTECATVAFIIGLVVSIVLFAIGDSWPEHVSAEGPTHCRMSGLRRFFVGAELNPRWMGVDIKMWLYLVGVFMVILTLVSAVAHECKRSGGAAGLHALFLVYVGEMLWFCFDYLVFEHVQLTTYDLFAENVGFKLAWGCLCFYPFFYPICVWPFVNPGGGLPAIEQLQMFWGQPVLSVVLFTCGAILSRGSNLQKYAFKTAMIRKRNFFFFRQESIAGKLLVSGFWGVSRHVNYLGEILMATGMALCGGLAQPFSYRVLLPWLYPLYYVILLFSREREDNRRCAQKYGTLWAVYQKRVPYRIIPYVY